MTKRNRPTDIFKHLDMSGGPEACWPFTGGLNDQGRPWFSVNGKKILAYRLVWDLVKEDKLGERKYLHQCDNPVCCNPAHGKPGTHEENMEDLKARSRHGLPHHTVRYVRDLLAKKFTHEKISELTGLPTTTISEISTGKNYSHVTETGTVYDEARGIKPVDKETET